MRCKIVPIELKLKRDFVVAGGKESLKRNYIFIIEEIGIGEAAGSVHYGVTPDDIEKDLNKAVNNLAGIIGDDIEEFSNALKTNICAPALCALSTAWYDWKSRQISVPLNEFLELEPPPEVYTSITVSVGDTEALADMIKDGYGRIKIKMDDDSSRNDELIDIIKNADGNKFRIDANSSWTLAEARRVVRALPEERVELIEQPFPPEAVEDWKRLRDNTGIPLFMDESIVSAGDVTRVAGYVDGVNIKIQKSGWLDTAVKAMQTARALGLKVMLGCMIESSVGIAAAYMMSSLADYYDLDGRLLVEDDPFSGLSYNKGILHLTDEYGHGVSFA
jgi:L-alanine-DL-glutamate epimerase-like enolase superfamily enzyme